jgi:hypothetical protein
LPNGRITLEGVGKTDADLRAACRAAAQGKPLRWLAIESLVESVLSRAIAMPAARFLRMKRAVSLLVSDRNSAGHGAIIEGTYQSPILIQWRRADGDVRVLDVTLTRLE